ncbi:WhiB family transcriptional regulator [Thalassiella azotivora]
MRVLFCRMLEEFAPDPSGDDPLSDAARVQLRAQIRPGWAERAGCCATDPDAWFPESSANRVEPMVSRVCADCPVRSSCLAAAILNDEHGIWGGTRRGARLHARARLLNGDPVPEVLSEVLAMPMGRTEYDVRQPVPTVLPTVARERVHRPGVGVEAA